VLIIPRLLFTLDYTGCPYLFVVISTSLQLIFLHTYKILTFIHPGNNSINFEPQQQQQQKHCSIQNDNRFTTPKPSDGQSKPPQTDKDDLSCGSKSEGEIESEDDDELDSTITSTPDDISVPEPLTPPNYYPALPSQSTEATTVSSLPGIREDVHTMV